MLEFLYSTGCRVGEVRKLDIEDILGKLFINLAYSPYVDTYDSSLIKKAGKPG